VFKLFKTLKRQPDAEPQRTKDRSFRAVSIQPGERACACAISLEAKRFLSGEAPRLPLRDCDRAACTCRYRHHEDRRREPRRYSDQAHFPRHYTGPERRTVQRGRRADDIIFQ
jgi:hypothetical protein